MHLRGLMQVSCAALMQLSGSCVLAPLATILWRQRQRGESLRDGMGRVNLKRGC
jgi:hypothetical protein